MIRSWYENLHRPGLPLLPAFWQQSIHIRFGSDYIFLHKNAVSLIAGPPPGFAHLLCPSVKFNLQLTIVIIT